MPGMRISRTRQPGSDGWYRSRKSSAQENRVTGRAADIISFLIAVRMPSSSSTTNTVEAAPAESPIATNLYRM